MDAVKFVEERRRMYTLGCIKKGINDYNTKAEAVVASELYDELKREVE